MPAAIGPRPLPLGTTARRKPSRAASCRRSSSWPTGRNWPPRPSSPTSTVPGGRVRSR